ncbi:aromatic prenyltransferase [Aspergillus californicus]
MANYQEHWQALTQCLRFPTSDHERWWRRVAPTLGRALHETGYTPESQLRHLLLIYSAVIPFLGPYPILNKGLAWRSCIAGHDGVPMDISVNYQKNSKQVIRMNFEPIGPHAGLHDDPINQYAAGDVHRVLARLQPGIDLTWYNQLEGQMVHKSDYVPQDETALVQFSNKTQMLFGLDFGEGSVVVKAYFFPLVRATATGTDWMRILFDSVRSLRVFTDKLQSEISAIETYFQSVRDRLLPEHSEVGFDCTSPTDQSRIKIYAAMKVSSLQDLYDFHTLGRYLQGSAIEKGFEILSQLWDMIYLNYLPDGRGREYLQVHCNWELSAHDAVPAPKIYFLVADELDEHVSGAVIGLFHGLGWHQQAEHHEALVKGFFDSQCGHKESTTLYTWLAFAYSESAGPYLTVYFKPPAPPESMAGVSCITECEGD